MKCISNCVFQYNKFANSGKGNKGHVKGKRNFKTVRRRNRIFIRITGDCIAACRGRRWHDSFFLDFLFLADMVGFPYRLWISGEPLEVNFFPQSVVYTLKFFIYKKNCIIIEFLAQFFQGKQTSFNNAALHQVPAVLPALRSIVWDWHPQALVRAQADSQASQALGPVIVVVSGEACSGCARKKWKFSENIFT